MRPKNTGRGQVIGRNSLCWEEKFVMDVFLLDLEILLLTVWRTLNVKNTNLTGHATMEAFERSNNHLNFADITENM